MTNAFIVLQTNTSAQGERMCFTLVMNVLVLERNALKVRIQTSPHTATHVATSDFQAAFFSKLLLTGTHL